MIRFASFFDTSSHVGTVVSIAVSAPKGTDYPEFLELAPNGGMVWKLKDGKISWEVYVAAYLKKIAADKEIIVSKLKNRKSEDVTFCCWEKDPLECHRSLASYFLRDLGYETELF